jgi:secreted trypsin-like serine protease
MAEDNTHRRTTRCRLAIAAAVVVLIIAGLLAEPLLPAIAARAGHQHELHPEVIGGKVVPQGKFPFMVFIEMRDNDALYACGGTLIDPRFVLTAAHCISDDDDTPFPPAAFTITIGKADLNATRSANRFAVTAVSRHPDWDKFTLDNDVAVLELAAPVPAKLARPIAVVAAGDGEFDQPGLPVIVAGWGNIGETVPSDDRLRATTLGIVGDDACAAAWGTGFNPAAMLCASAPDKAQCYGDSGGPLFAKDKIGTKKKRVHAGGKTDKHRKRTKRVPVFRDVQIGIVSFSGETCIDPTAPNVATQLSDPAINGFVTGVVNG